MAAGNPSRTGIRRPTTRTAKIVWVAIGVGVLAALVGTILNSTNEQPLPDSPQDATQIESAFQNSGITLTKYEYSNGRVTCAIDTGEWVTVGPANLRVHLAGSLQELYTLAQKYPEIEDIYVDLNSPMKSFGYAAQSKTSPLAPFSFDRREPNPDDVVLSIDYLSIDYCGICHSDIHQVRGEWGRELYPMVPGHEIVGHVTAVGGDVKRFKVGDRAAVGVIVESCMHCDNCKADLEVYCTDGGARDTYNAELRDGSRTYGGYSNNIVTPEHFVHTLSPKIDMAATAPLLCAGITTYSPLKHWKVGKNSRVGIVGLGGLGHMGLKFAHSFGAYTVLFTTSESKINDALKLGADEVVLSKDAAAMAKHAGSFDFILDCVSAPHDMNAYLGQLRLDGVLCLVGLPDQPLTVAPFSLLANRRSLAGSAIGGMKETQEMLDYCAEKGIVSDIELIGYDKLPEAYDRVIKGDVKYRFVLDGKTLK
jgi:uncharacterized zinc-type alcohol dehydrogenase-like protein